MEDILVGEIERLKGEVALLKAARDIWYERTVEVLTQRDEARAWARRLYRALVEIRGLAENEAYIYGYEVEAILNIVHKALGGK